MKNRLLLAILVTAVMIVPAHAERGIRAGIPVPLPPSVVVRTAPEFIFSPSLGFHVSVGAPYDIVYFGNDYYLYNNGYYYRSDNYSGPWTGIENRRLPPGLRKYRYEDIRRFRDKEYRTYSRDREHYNGRWHRPGEGVRSEHRGGEGRGDEGRGGGHGGVGQGGEHRGGGDRH